MRTVHHQVHHVAPASLPPVAPTHPGQASASAQSHAHFHQQRAGVLRPMPRPASPQLQQPGAMRNRTAQQARSAAEPENALMGMIATVQEGGAHDDERMFDGAERDPLRRDARLTPVQAAQRHEVAEGGGADHAALTQMQERLGGGADVGGASALDDALALAGRIATPGAGSLLERVAALRRSSGQAPAMRRQDADGVQVWIAQRQAASLQLLASCLEYGASLHAKLQTQGLLAHADGGGQALAPAERTGLGLLEAGRVASADVLATRVGAVGAKGHQLLAATLRELSHELWPSSQARSKLLHELDLAAADDAAPAGAAVRTERQLRATQDNQEDGHA